ncbi:MAG: hypothetical protein D6731_09950 [Planctomycetota bacterium]|nr:MAG: hypothetical protein D6731_09950 [Planctomycetota bacterium]
MRVLDIAPDREKRREFSQKFTEDGHAVYSVPGRREALELLAKQEFDLCLLDANSDLYDTRELVEEVRSGAENEPVIAVFVEPRNRPPRHRIAGRAANVVVLQDGSVDHMARMIHLAMSMREGDAEEV